VPPLLISVTSPALATLAKVAYVTCRQEGVSSGHGATAVYFIDGGVARARPIEVSIAVTPPNAL
jgi:hypothetical protein